MRILFFTMLSLALSGPPALAAPAGTPDDGTKTGSTEESGSSAASAPADPAATPAEPVNPDEKFGVKWAATKRNSDMLKDEQLVNEETRDGNLAQEDAFLEISAILDRCIYTTIEGRSDAKCKDDPNHPECTGVFRSVKNATHCLEYFDPPSSGCKVHGTQEYGLEEWAAVAKQYAGEMARCKSQSDAYLERKNSKSLGSLTEVMGLYNPKTAIPGAPNLKGVLLAPSSTVSGSIKPDMKVGPLDWDELSNRVKDGASYLGYQEGDIVRATFKGESFSSIFTESPFAQNLNYVQRAKLEEALNDSEMVAMRVIQTHRAKNGDSSAEEQIANEDAQAPSSGINGGSISYGSENAMPIDVKQLDYANNGRSLNGKYASNPAAQAAAAASQAEVKKWLEAERIEAVARAAALARTEKKPYRSPSTLSQPNAEDLLNATLFQRVSLAYRRRSPGMRPLDSRNGDMIRSIERPEIFRDL